MKRVKQILITGFFIVHSLSAMGMKKPDRVTIAFSLSDSLDIQDASVSCAIVNGNIPQGSSLSISTEILLKSELQGHVENPEYYFEAEGARVDSDLDLLMLTQGWRRYEVRDVLDDSIPQLKFTPEQAQSISGHVENAFNRNPKGMYLGLFIPSTTEIMRFPLGDNNRFVFSNMDFEDGTQFTLEAQKKDGLARTASIYIDEPEMPKVRPLEDTVYIKQQEDSLMTEFADFSKHQPRVASLNGIRELDELNVTGRKTAKWSNRGNFEPYSGYKAGDERIGRYPNMESLFRSLGVRIRYSEDSGIGREPQFGEYVMNTFIPTTTYVDGFRSEQSEAFNLVPSNILNVEYFRPGDSRVASYGMDVITSGLMLINTKYGNEGGRDKWLSMINITPLGYQPAVEFYVPKYSVDEVAAPDYLSTLYWNPSLNIPSSGQVEVELFSPESLKTVNVTLQGMTPDGRIIDVHKKLQLR